MSPTKKAKDTKTQPFRIGHTELHTADCLDWLGNRAEKSIAAVVTDPPTACTNTATSTSRNCVPARAACGANPPPSTATSAHHCLVSPPCLHPT